MSCRGYTLLHSVATLPSIIKQRICKNPWDAVGGPGPIGTPAQCRYTIHIV